jgi:hypothetical protein
MYAPFSATAQQTLTASHSINVRATAFTAALGVQANLPVSGGSVTVDGTSQVRREATITIADPTLWPANPLDMLSVIGSELSIEYGIVIPGQGTEWIPLIRGGISKAARTIPVDNNGGVTLSIVDRSARVAEDRLLAPTQVGGGSTTVVQAITALVQDAFPAVVVVDKTGSSAIAPVLDIDKDRWAAVEQLADSIAAECFFDQVGQLVVRPQPTLADPTVWVVGTGRSGVLVRRSDEQTRDLVYNAVVASGARTDGTTAPVTVTVTDSDPASPTYWGGPFGKKPRFYSSPLLTTTLQATTAAQALLERVRGMQASVSLEALCNPALEAGDVVLVKGASTREAHILDKVTVPLDPRTTQQLSTRSKVLPSESSS